MNSDSVLPFQSVAPETQPTQIQIDGGDRWQVYHRLKDLEIPCQCRAHKALKVFVTTPTEALLVWSVVRQVSQPKGAQVAWLKHCWHLA
jgi:hypothetical protein